MQLLTLLMGVPLAPVALDAGRETASSWVPLGIALLVNTAMISVWAGGLNSRVQTMREEHARMYVGIQASLCEIKAEMYTRHEACEATKRADAEHTNIYGRLTRIEQRQDRDKGD